MSLRPQRGLDAIQTYVPGKPICEVERELGLTDVVKLASNENPYGVSPKALAAMQTALAGGNVYPDGSSYDLRVALAGHFGFALDQVVVGNGADDIILELSMAYLDDGDEVIVSRSSFPIYDIYAHAMRAKLVKTPLAPGYRIDLDAMARAITPRTRMVYVCNPNNPTGTIVTADDLARFLRRVPDHALVVLDDAYAEMADSPEFPDSLGYVRDGRPNVVVLRTYSKIYGLAGIRIGYGFGHRDTLAPLFKVKEAFNVSVVAQAAGIAALDDAEFVEFTVAENRKGREFLCREFARLGLAFAESHTNFVLVEIGPQAGDVQQRLLCEGVIVRPCAAYDLPKCLRVSIGTPAENDRFLAALERVLAAIR
ncbi:MAG: histidinol-phosphate transaminase [Candidatus Bipolaricaulota bacterium]